MGRHGTRSPGRTRPVVIGVLATALLGVLVWQGWVFFGDRMGNMVAAASATAEDGCSSPEKVTVVTTMAMSSTLRSITGDVDACADFVITAEPATTTASRFGADDATLPQVWVPDSAQLAEQAAEASDQVTTSPTFATSPVVIAVPEGLDAPDPLSWGTALVDPDCRVPDPETSTVGHIAVMMGLSEIGALPEKQQSSAFTGMSEMMTHIVPEDSLFSEYATEDPALFPTTEQQVQQAEVAGMSVVAVDDPTPPLEYSVVSTSSAPSEAVSALSRALTSSGGQKALRDAGFRTPTDDSPVLEGGPSGDAVAATVAPEEAQSAEEMWKAVTTPTRLLIVIDTSGSMSEPAAKDLGSRIDVATQAASVGIPLLDDRSEVGLWMFSTEQRGSRDWTQLEPIRALGEGDQRTKLSFSLGSLSTRLGGDTGLYDTLDAAYAEMMKDYDPDAVNLLALFTDGVNDDPSGGLSLSGMKSRIDKVADPGKPVTVFLIGMGSADGKTLGPVARAMPTGGGGGGEVFTIRTPEDISGVYVNMMMRRMQ